MLINENGAKRNIDRDSLLLVHIQADHFTPTERFVTLKKSSNILSKSIQHCLIFQVACTLENIFEKSLFNLH